MFDRQEWIENMDTSSAEAFVHWLQSECPEWCVVDHADDERDPPRHLHRREQKVATLLKRTERSDAPAPQVDVLEFLVTRGRHGDEICEWVSIEPLSPDCGRLMLTVESARILSGVLAELADPNE
jgi:hypothetical protein